MILLSARAGEEARIEGLEAGADEYLVKPFSARELLASIASQLQLSRERRETERALRYRSEQYQTLLNQAPIGVYVVDADFRIRDVNPVALPVFGNIPGGVVGRDFDEIIHILWEPDYADEIVRIFRHTLETGEPYFTPERVRTPPGSRREGVLRVAAGSHHAARRSVRCRLLFPRYCRAEEERWRRRRIWRRSSTRPTTRSSRKTWTASSSRAMRPPSGCLAIRPTNSSDSRFGC